MKPEYTPSDSGGDDIPSSNDRLDLLVRRLAHDLNNQLTVIHGNTELAQMDTEADHPALVSVLEIKAACARAREIVQQILKECHRFSDAEPSWFQADLTGPTRMAGVAGEASACRSILLVDDEPSFVDLAKRFLERSGHRVMSYVQAEAAIQAFQAEPGRFDLVISDVNMPGISGFELAEAIQAVRSDISVILTSGVVRSEDHERARQIGIQRIVSKPDTIEAFVKVIQDLLKS